jgi:hypothetical protein
VPDRINEGDMWDMPGPRRFIGGITGEVRSGHSIIVSCPLNLLTEVTQRIRFALRLLEHRVDTLDPEVSPQDALSRAIPAENEGRVLFDRVAESGLRTYIVSAESPDSRVNWEAFMGRFQHHAMRLDSFSRATIVVVTTYSEAGNINEVALKQASWRFVWTEVDSLALAGLYAAGRPRQTIADKVVTHTISRLALCDASLAALLADVRHELLSDPIPLLIEAGIKRGWDANTPESHNNGTLTYLDGAPAVHSCLVALRSHGHAAGTAQLDEISVRRWHAQATVLLPWIEMQRQLLTSRVFRFIKQCSDDPQAMEIGPLWYELRKTNAPSREKTKASILRNARNRIAHSSILTYEDINQLVHNFDSCDDVS